MNRWISDREGYGPARARRLIVLGALLLAILAARLFYLQILAAGGYSRLARDNQFRELRIPAPRGLILDRQGRVLADNHTACEATLSTRVLARHAGIVRTLAPLIELPPDDVRTRLENGRASGKPRITLARNLSKEQILILEERLPELPGLKLQDWARRTYPEKDLAAHLLGYVGEVGESEVSTRRQDPRAYRLGDMIGRAGLEKTYEPLLRGKDGKKLVLVNARGVELETVEFLPPEPGNELWLTLDLELCAVLDSALTYWGAGSGVVMDVHTGEVLAAASRPAFDPNQLIGGISTELWSRLSEDPDKPLFNRITQAMYAPGSTFKPLVALAALEAGSVGPGSLLEPCLGGLRLGRRFFRCWEPSGHGSLPLVGAIEESCDVYFYQLGEALGVDPIADMSRRFALGAITGIDLPSESSGLVPDSRWYDERYGKGKWTRGQVWNVSIGQGEVLVNVLQMVRMYAALANGGFLPVPRLRHHVDSATDENLIPFSPSRGERVDLSSRNWRNVNRGLLAVVEGEDGTARGSSLPGFPCAGKTGTVQNPHGTEHAWFCGYAPAENPEIAIALIVEHGEHGSDIAPIFRELVNRWFHLGQVSQHRGRRPRNQTPPPPPPAPDEADAEMGASP